MEDICFQVLDRVTLINRNVGKWYPTSIKKWRKYYLLQLFNET